MRWSAAVCAIGLATTGAGAPAGAQVFRSSAGDVAVETVAKGLDHPWAFAFLPAGRMLVTERPGRMRIVAKDGALSPALGGMPKVFASGQGACSTSRSTVASRRIRPSISVTLSRWRVARAPRSRALGWWTKARPGSMRSR